MTASDRTPGPAEPPEHPRDLAWRILVESEGAREFVSDRLDDVLPGSDPRDRSLTRELVLGAIRRRMTLDAALRTFCRRPQSQVEPQLWQLLRLGAYQLMYLDRIPAHAAVHETVEVARRGGRSEWCRFANGILRALARAVRDDPDADDPRRTFPIDEVRSRAFDRDVFADPSADRVKNLSQRYNIPQWLLERWTRQFDDETLQAILLRDLQPASLVLRVNRLRTDRENVLEMLAAAGVAASAGDLPEAVRIDRRANPHDLPGLHEGLLSIQDATPMRAADWLDPQPGETILDLCAAPGTKTAHLAERMGDRGTVFATDVSAERLRKIEQNVRRLGLSCVVPQLIARDGSDIPAGPFDAILVDAPCTNTGVLSKRIEVRHRLRESEIAELATIQQRLLQQAAIRLKPGGRLLYSTCSLEPEENGENIRRFLELRPELELVREELVVPGLTHDGGYLALMRMAKEKN